jgi:hypothetical protein
MFRHLFGKSFLIPALALSALMALPSISHAQFKQGDWVMTLEGAGGNDKAFSHGEFLVEGSIGYFLTQNVELSLRQEVGYAAAGATVGEGNLGGGTVGHSETVGVTQVAADWVFNLGAWAPYVGGNFGMAYGTRERGSDELGAEVGIRYFINATTFVFAQAEWDLPDVNEKRSEFLYTLGLGVKLN